MVGPGEQAEDNGLRAGDFAPAPGVGQVAVEAGEWGKTLAGVGDSLEGVDAAADLGDGHGGTFGMDRRDGRDWDSGDFVGNPFISAHFRSFE